MGLLNRLFGSAPTPPADRQEPHFSNAGNPENPTTPLSDIASWEDFLGTPGSGQEWMPRVRETTSMACSAVYRCVTLEAGVIAGLPLKIWKQKDNGEREEAARHRLAPLLNVMPYPGRSLTAFSWRELWGLNLLLWGNHYSAIRYDGAARVIGFETFMPWQVQVVRIPSMPGVNFYVCTHPDGRVETVLQGDMLHIPGPGFDGLKGLSRIQSFARGSVGLAQTMEERTGRLHQNAALPSGVMQVPSKMNDASFRRMKAQIENNYSGVSKWGRTIIVDDGAKYTPFQLSPQDLQTIEARRYQVADISRFFGVPLHLLNETDKTTSWGSGLSENTLAYLIFTLDADLKRIEGELNAKLFLGTPYFVEFDRDGLLSMDPQKAAAVTAQQISSGQLTINESRKKRNLPAVQGGDTVLVNSTNVPLEQQASKQNGAPQPAPSQPHKN
ncbi:phage portal protein [Acetobacter tropicalis]|uniref:Phage portal protein n=1 Tax=Acetobacter tropicalis TaxID=104102 RepID=A0A095AYU0_9PROT|nr:phage portal protein [Acetobacter tropicalis]KAA8384052.1 phage portal protein [Acetobacter tropicalis]KAA8391267.1 phage portal protein [Acetobacter tropicalis]KGB21908.1 Phage portal protein [Acetobacter tropicalis]MDO8173251.1 phage portal protein [Acetobacter tropicalis]